GSGSQASGQSSTAVGGSGVFGGGANASGAYASAFGHNARATAQDGTAVGTNTLAGRDTNSVSDAIHTTAIGTEAWATEDGAAVVGYNSYAQALDSVVLGSNAWTTKAAHNSVSLGAGSLADRANTVSVGAAQDWTDAAGVVHAAIDRQITNVAAGTEATDAVNLAQLEQATASSRYFAATGSEDSDAGAYAEGDEATAAGEAANAIGNGATAVGGGALAYDDGATAIGRSAMALGADSNAIGTAASAGELNGVATG